MIDTLYTFHSALEKNQSISKNDWVLNLNVSDFEQKLAKFGFVTIYVQKVRLTKGYKMEIVKYLCKISFWGCRYEQFWFIVLSFKTLIKLNWHMSDPLYISIT